jgi:hypothetical protein
MASGVSYLHAHAPRIRRVARAASLALLALTVLAFMGTDLPAAEALRTKPFVATCFLGMMFGLAISWRHLVQAGVITAVAWTLLAGATRGATAVPLSAFMVVAIVNVAAGCCGRQPEQED